VLATAGVLADVVVLAKDAFERASGEEYRVGGNELRFLSIVEEFGRYPRFQNPAATLPAVVPVNTAPFLTNMAFSFYLFRYCQLEVEERPVRRSVLHGFRAFQGLPVDFLKCRKVVHWVELYADGFYPLELGLVLSFCNGKVAGQSVIQMVHAPE